MRSYMLEAPGGPVHVADFGGSGARPLLLLVHGLGGSHLNWLSVADRLARHGRVVAIDLPGFGRTPTAGRQVSMTALVGVLDEIAARLSDRPVALVGNSMGGLLSIALAAQRPATVAALVLVDPAVPPPRRHGLGLDMITRNFVLAYGLPTPAAVRLKRLADRRGAARLVSDILELCAFDVGQIDRAVIAAHIDLERERLIVADWHISVFSAARSLLRTLSRRRKFEGWVSRITVPTLLVHGAHDRVVSLRSARALAALRPDWEFEVFEDAGHIPMLETPGPFVDVVATWLDRAMVGRNLVGAGIG